MSAKQSKDITIDEAIENRMRLFDKWLADAHSGLDKQERHAFHECLWSHADERSRSAQHEQEPCPIDSPLDHSARHLTNTCVG